MTIGELAEEKGVNVESLKKKLRRGNMEVPGEAQTLSAELIRFLTSDGRRSSQINVTVKPSGTPTKKSVPRQKGLKRPHNNNLQKRLSADWLIMLVLLVILWADMFAFGVIGHNEFKNKIDYSAIFFSIIGLATGIGSVVTYNRIKDNRTAEIWKWCFGVMQFSVFSLAINEQWFFAEMVMTSMFVLVFIGVQRSIKK